MFPKASANVCAPLVLRRAPGMVVRIEELEPVASPRGWTLTVTLNRYEQTPGGSRQLLATKKYNYKPGAADETKEEQGKRLDVKRNARQRAMQWLENPEKYETKKAKRRKGSQPPPPPPPPPLPATLPAPSAVLAPRGTPMTEWAAVLDPEGQDLATRRDWALLRAWKQQPTPDAVLRALRALP